MTSLIRIDVKNRSLCLTHIRKVSICSGIVEEFTTDPNTVDTRRVPPETNVEIIEFAKKRNPFNHPA